jgi:type IV fimbrial biogenesis protein FimT
MLIRGAKSAAGFTLLEAMITLTVFAVLTAIAIPNMRTWIMNNKVRGVADALQNGLRLAQSESLRQSRQVVFVFTDTTTPTTIPLAAAAGASSWAIYTVPSMTDGGEPPRFVQAGELSNASTGVTLTSNPATAAFCFNSAGRLVGNGSLSVTAITGGVACNQPVGPQQFSIAAVSGGDRPLQVTLGLGGQVHMCDPGVPISDSHPEGC